jgi:hypothetical protein
MDRMRKTFYFILFDIIDTHTQTIIVVGSLSLLSISKTCPLDYSECIHTDIPSLAINIVLKKNIFF